MWKRAVNFELLDRILGLRSWGLVLYGALPASLSLLGFLEIKVGVIDHPLAILLVSLLPLFVTFLLVRARERDWYLTNDYLYYRSIITTILIVACATAISAAAGLIRQRYHFDHLPLLHQAHFLAVTECFLFGVASLVVSSTLFATILTKGADLPGLPSSGFVIAVGKIRQQLIALQNSEVWKNYELNSGITFFDSLNTEGTTLIADLQIALSQPGHRLAKKSLGLSSLKTDLSAFNESVVWIKEDEEADTILFRWRTYFGDFRGLDAQTVEPLNIERNRRKTTYEALQRIKGLRLGG